MNNWQADYLNTGILLLITLIIASQIFYAAKTQKPYLSKNDNAFMKSPKLFYRNVRSEVTRPNPIFKETYDQMCPNLQRLQMRKENLFLKITLQKYIQIYFGSLLNQSLHRLSSFTGFLLQAMLWGTWNTRTRFDKTSKLIQ